MREKEAGPTGPCAKGRIPAEELLLPKNDDDRDHAALLFHTGFWPRSARRGRCAAT